MTTVAQQCEQFSGGRHRLTYGLLLCQLLTLAWLTGCTAPAHQMSPTGRTSTCLADTDTHPHARFRLLGEVRWSHETQYLNAAVGGLSSIDYDAQNDTYFLVSDDRSVHAPARFYTAQIRYGPGGLHDVRLTSMRSLTNHNQQAYAAANAPDPEALRVVPGGQSMLWSNEGSFARGVGPEVNESSRGGQWARTWSLPQSLQLPANGRSQWGPRNDATLEGMSFSDDGNTLWLAMEGPLRQDGPMPSPGQAGGPVRITAIDVHTRKARQQLAYQTDALPGDIWLMPQRALNGVSDVLADGPDHLLVLERSFAVPLRFGARLYRISTRIDDADPSAASDTLHLPELNAGSFRAARKELLIDFSQLGLRSVDNLEGMTWGPRLASGERVLLLVSDNNFNPAQVTQFIALMESTACNTE